MNCEEFRSQYNGWLDRCRSSPLSPEAVLHVRGCSACGVYANAMTRIDAGLQHIPDVPLPEVIFPFTGTAGAITPLPGGRLSSPVHSGAAIALPALAAWIASLYIPLPWQLAVQLLLASGAMVLFSLVSFRPKFIA